MAIPDTKFEQLLCAERRQVVADALRASSQDMSLPQAHKLTARLQALDEPVRPLRVALVHTYTSDLLEPWLALEAALAGLELSTFHAPYGLCLQEAHSGSDLALFQADLTIFLLRREDLHPAFSSPRSTLTPEALEALSSEVQSSLAAIIAPFRAQLSGHFAISLLPAMLGPDAGLYDSQAPHSEAAWWANLKQSIGDYCRDQLHSSTFLDLDEALLDCGRKQFFDQRLWHSAQFPFAPVGAREVCRRLVSIGVLLKAAPAKVIVLDADNTLWGGVIGEDGMTGIALGTEYPGSLYVAFQRRLLALSQRGFLLAVCSKNNPEDFDQVLREHPHQLLKPEHFAAMRVNWEPKPDNLISLAQELNLGLESFVFVDDSDYECASVRHRLPEVDVIQVPTRPLDVPVCLDRVPRLETLSVTAEDLVKTQMYAQENQRKQLMKTVGDEGNSYDEYLSSLQMTMSVALDDASQLPRLAQLTQKTNQYNLTTARFTEEEMAQCLASSDWRIFHFSLADTFGDSGVVGLAMVELGEQGKSRLHNFLMSCRVIGRRAEDAFFAAVCHYLSKQGFSTLEAQYEPTAKNAPVKDFLPQQGFEHRAEGGYSLSLADDALWAKSVPIDIETQF